MSCERFSVSSIQLSASLRQKIHALHTYIYIIEKRISNNNEKKKMMYNVRVWNDTLLWVSCERFSVSSIQLSDSVRQKIHALHTYIYIYYWKTHFRQRKEEEKRWRLIVAWNRSNDVWLERSYVYLRGFYIILVQREREIFETCLNDLKYYLVRYKMYCSSQSLHQSIRYLQRLLS